MIRLNRCRKCLGEAVLESNRHEIYSSGSKEPLYRTYSHVHCKSCKNTTAIYMNNARKAVDQWNRGETV